MTFKKGQIPWNKGRKIKESHPQIGFQKRNQEWNNSKSWSTRFLKGVCYSPETQFQKGHIPRLDNRRSYKGENNPAYKGGMAFRKKGEKKHLCSKYKHWMKAVKIRDDWKCKIANKSCSGRIEAHHIFPWREYLELRYEINNGITLCRVHHPRGRTKEKRLSLYFQEIVSVSSKIF